jgi:hypothetical protein
MSTTNKTIAHKLNPLVIEVEEVIKNGLNKILGDYMDRYELLENTHKQLMQLPSIRQELNKNPYELDSEYDSNNSINCKNNMWDRSTIESIEYRLEKLENKYDTLIPALDKILNKIVSLDQEVKSLKSCENFSQAKSSTSKSSAKENIKIHFEEPSEELVEEESDEEDVNPLLNKEQEKVSHEEILNPEEVVIPSDETLPDANLAGEVEVDVEEESKPDTDAEPDANLAGDVEEETEEVVKSDVEAVVDEDSEANIDAEPDTNLVGDVEKETEEVVESDVEEEEASIETETKSEVEEEEEDEPIKQVVEEKPPSEEEDDVELFEIEIDDKTYCTTDDQNGFIWELTEDGEQGEKIGYFENGDAYFYEDEN